MPLAQIKDSELMRIVGRLGFSLDEMPQEPGPLRAALLGTICGAIRAQLGELPEQEREAAHAHFHQALAAFGQRCPCGAVE